MKIGIVCPYNIWRGGGVQECVLAMQKELMDRGHTALIITPQPRNHEEVLDDHVLIIGKSTAWKGPSTSNEISVSANLEALQETLEKEKFDILHFHEPWMPFVSRQILSRSNAVNVATFHAKLPETVVIKTFEQVIVPYLKSIQKYIDGMSAVSPAAAEYVKRVSPGRDIVTIPNGIDLDKYKPNRSKQSAEHKTILYVGRLEKRKGVIYLLKAYKEALKLGIDAKLIIAGEGPDRPKLEEWVIDHGVSGVEFVGYVSEEKKYDLLNEADIFCSPALYGESFGIVLLEAMAMGVVTIAGNNSGYSSVMTGRGRISLVSPKDTKAFSHKLELLLSDEQIRKSWQDWAQDYVQRFDYKKVVDLYEAFYKESLATHAKKVRQ